MRKILKIALLTSISLLFVNYSLAQSNSWAGYWSTPMQVLDTVVDKANATDDYQRTALDGITDLQWTYKRSRKISNTFDYLRMHIWPYIQWAVYIGLVLSTAGLIICWLLMVTWWISKTKWFESVKWKIVNALLWVFFLSWFYLLIDLIVWLTNSIFTP